MDNTVIVKEENREFINKAKNFMRNKKQSLENFRADYKENYVDTGKSQELEEKIVKNGKKAKKAIKVLGTIATIGLMVCPVDGPFGEICTMLATPSLCALVDLAVKIRTKALITGKRSIEKHLLKVDGSNGKISGYNLENKEIIDDFSEFLDRANDFTKPRSR